MRASVTLVPARRSGGLTHVVAVRGDLARPPVPGAVGQFGPVAALVGLVGGMGRQRIPYVGRCAVRGRGLGRGCNNLDGARVVRAGGARLVRFERSGAQRGEPARKMYVGLWMANRNRRVVDPPLHRPNRNITGLIGQDTHGPKSAGPASRGR